MLRFTLTKRPRAKLDRFGSGTEEAAMFETTRGRILALHYCPCHDFWPYTPRALKEVLKEGKIIKIICCFPAGAKRRHPELAPFIVGDWEGATRTTSGYREGYSELIVTESKEATIEHFVTELCGIDHMGGMIPRYREPLKKAA